MSPWREPFQGKLRDRKGLKLKSEFRPLPALGASRVTEMDAK